MTVAKTLIDRLETRTAVIGILGLGYVGLPLVLRYTEAGYKVLGFDVDEVKIDRLNTGISYINHIASNAIASALTGGFVATGDFSRVAEVDALLICVPTPLGEHREPDLSYVLGTLESILPYLRRGQVISLESTTYPGTTDDELLPRIEESGYRVGDDVFLVYSPEREDPANIKYTTKTIPKVCGGTTAACLEVGLALYRQVIDTVVPVSSTRVAELTKLLENIHRAVNIGLVNELKMVADRMGIDLYEVIDAAATKPFGFVPYYPGPGLGGHCIPIDPFYLTWKAHEYDVHTRFIELAGEVNSQMPEWVVGKVADGLNRHKKAINGSRILVLGIAYKKNVDDTRESPAVHIMDLLRERGAQVEYSDPYIHSFPAKRRYAFDLKSIELTAESLSQYDAVALITDHDDFDYELIRSSSKLIIDARGVYRDAAEHIIRA